MKSALLIIDVQTALFATTPPPDDADAVIGRINEVSERARRKGIPVYLIQHEEPFPELTFNAPGWAIDRRVVVSASDIRIRKTTPDSFLRTPLLESLRAQSIDHLVVCGYASEFCVDTTVRSAAAQGFPVTLVSDGHTTCDQRHLSGAAIRAHHTATLTNIDSFGVKIDALPAGALWTAA